MTDMNNTGSGSAMDALNHLREAAIMARSIAGPLVILELTPIGIQTEASKVVDGKLSRYRQITTWEQIGQARGNILIPAIDLAVAKLSTGA